MLFCYVENMSFSEGICTRLSNKKTSQPYEKATYKFSDKVLHRSKEASQD